MDSTVVYNKLMFIIVLSSNTPIHTEKEKTMKILLLKIMECIENLLEKIIWMPRGVKCYNALNHNRVKSSWEGVPFRGFCKIKNNIEICGLLNHTSILVGNGKNNEIHIGKARLHNCIIMICGSENKVIIGDGCEFSNTELRCGGSNNCISIEDNVKIGGAVIEASNETNISIGKDSLLSTDIDIRSGYDHPIYEIEGDKQINRADNISIGNNVWLGKRVTILRGGGIFLMV